MEKETVLMAWRLGVDSAMGTFFLRALRDTADKDDEAEAAGEAEEEEEDAVD